MNPDTIASVVESGDSDEVNDLLDELKDRDVDERLRLFEECYETLLECMNLEDGYSRQAVVRIVSALDPGTGRMVVETDPERFETISDEAFADAVDRATAFFVAALADRDGRVRRAAIRSINSLCVGCRMVGDRESIQQLCADLDDLTDQVDDEQREHVEEARDTALGQLH